LHPNFPYSRGKTCKQNPYISLTNFEDFKEPHEPNNLVNSHSQFPTKYLWKLKIPLKTKNFMWFLHKKELLIKHNLFKRRWNGCNKCCFCDSGETIERLFLACPFRKVVWRIIYSTYNIPPPTNVKNMFGNWLNGIDKMTRARIQIRVSALCWSI
jgi:hypothetical protein